MTINSTAPIALAMYLAVAEKHGTPWEKVGGTLQNDILKEYIAQKEYIFPPRPSMRLITDQFSFCAKHVPKWNTISISGYHIREAGSTALQELAFTLRDGVEYVKYGIEAGLPVDEFAPRLSFFFNSHNDFFEEIAKFRAARRVWAEDHAGALRGEGPALLDVPLPHPDGRVLADGSAALQQRRPHGDPGARGGARRDATRSTPTRSTRPSRCPPTSPSSSRCGPSRSSPTNRASRTRSTRSAAPTSSRT